MELSLGLSLEFLPRNVVSKFLFSPFIISLHRACRHSELTFYFRRYILFRVLNARRPSPIAATFSINKYDPRPTFDPIWPHVAMSWEAGHPSYTQKPCPHHTPTRICTAIDHTLDSIHPLDTLLLSYCTPFVCSGFRACGPDSAQAGDSTSVQTFDGATRIGNGDRVCVPLVLLALLCSA